MAWSESRLIESEQRLTPEMVTNKLAWMHQKRDFLISIDTDEHVSYEKPTTIKVTFTFLKKKEEA